MSAITTTTTTAATTSPDHETGRVSWKNGILTGVVAAVAVTLVAGAFRLADHGLSAGGAIPLLAFGQFVLLFSIVGIVIARHTGRATFFRVAIALTVLSFVPDLVLGDSLLSRAGLMLTHVVAAAIVIPRLARR